MGGIEASKSVKVGFKEHARWALQYHDRWFAMHHMFPFVVFGMIQKRDAMWSVRLQMRRKDFERDTLAVASVTMADLKKAEQEKGQRELITNPRVHTLHHHVVATNSKVMGGQTMLGLSTTG